MTNDRQARIRALNDEFRRSLPFGSCGRNRLVITAGVSALGPDAVAEIIARVAAFDVFTPDNDPHAEHDFGIVEHGGERLYWKIDLYDRDLRFGSEDPADPEQTTRVLTILRADEY